jgi:hypothetical protein
MWQHCASSSCLTGERASAVELLLPNQTRVDSIFRKDAGVKIGKGLAKIKEVVARFSRMN